MEEMTIQRRTIVVDKRKTKVNLKWTEKQRTPRKLKKRLKKNFGSYWKFSKHFSQMTFINGCPSKNYSGLYVKGIEEYGK